MHVIIVLIKAKLVLVAKVKSSYQLLLYSVRPKHFSLSVSVSPLYMCLHTKGQIVTVQFLVLIPSTIQSIRFSLITPNRFSVLQFPKLDNSRMAMKRAAASAVRALASSGPSTVLTRGLHVSHLQISMFMSNFFLSKLIFCFFV